MTLTKLLVTTTFLSCSAGFAFGQCAGQNLPNGPVQANDHFGSAVAGKGNTLIVGCEGDDNARGVDAGIAYVCTKVNGWWDISTTLLPADLPAASSFGQSVAMDTYIAVGANQAPNIQSFGTGSVYMYAPSGNTWVQQDKVVSPDAAAGDAFGYAVATQGDWLAVGAPGDDSGGKSGNGAVYLYHRVGNDWQFSTKFAFLAEDYGYLGISLAMKNNFLVIGSHKDVNGIAEAGAVYVYKFNGASWVFNDYLPAPSPQDAGRFGESVSIDGTTLAIGAYLVDQPGPNSPDGSVYAYNLVNGHFVLAQTLHTEDLLLGRSVALNGDVLVSACGQWAGGYITQMFRRYNGVWTDMGRWIQPSGEWGDMDPVVAMTDTDILLGMGGMNNGATVDGGRLQVMPKTVLISADDFYEPQVIGQGTTFGCNSLATNDGYSFCGNSATALDVWFSYTPSNTRRVMFDTIGANFDTVLSLHTGPNMARNHAEACDDDGSGQGLTSKIVYRGVPGQEMRIRVSGYSTATGWFPLHVTELCPADFNADATVDFFDYLDFVDAFSANIAAADFNEDGAIDFFDYLDYVDAFSSGC